MPRGAILDANPHRDADEEDAKLERTLRLAWMTILVPVIGVFGALATIDISGAVIARAKIVVEANAKAVQHLEGGIVREVRVQDGAAVEAGDVLVRLAADRLGDRMNGLRAERDARLAQLALLDQELSDLKTLEEKRLIARKVVAEAKRQKAGLQGEIGKLNAELSRTSTAQAELVVRAPVAGRVHELSVHNAGAVITPGQTLMLIVPSDAPLVFEARVDPRDIDQVRGGQSVTIRLTSFNQRTTPELAGSVAQVSADLVRDETTGTMHYLARIGLGQDERERLGDRRLVPGMPADVFIETDQRTILSYLLKPLADHWQGAFREQ